MLVETRVRRIFVPVVICYCLIWFCGCGGDSPTDPGGNGNPSGLYELQGQVILPEGCATDPASLRLTCGASESSVESDGGFELQLFDDSGQLVVAATGRGNPLLMAWLGDETDEINVRATAEALTWLALGSWLLPTDAGQHIRELIAELGSELNALETAIAAELVAHPEGFGEFNQAIHDALAVTVDVLIGDGAGAAAKGVLIEPADQRSGVEVLNRGGVNSIVIKNAYRRRVWVSLDRMAWIDQDDNEHELDEPANVFELGPTGGFAGFFGTIASYFTGDIAYTPIETAPIALDCYPEAKYTRYTLVTGGMGVVAPDAEDALSLAETEAIEYVALKTVVWDFFVPLVFNIMATLDQKKQLDNLGGLGEGQAGDLLTLLNYTKDTVPAVYNHAIEGNSTEALHALWGAVSNTGQYQDAMFNFIRDLVISLGADAPAAGAAAQEAAKFLKALGWIDIVGGYIDSALVAGHIGLCDVADRWDIKVNEPKISLLPPYVAVPMGGRVDTLRARVVDDTGVPQGSSYAYHWRCDGNHGWIENPMNLDDTSNDFVISGDWVSYVAFLNTTGTDSVYVTVYKTLWGNQEYVGQTAGAVNVVEVVPVRLVLRGSETTDFDIHEPMWWLYDTEGYILTGGLDIWKWINGEYRPPNQDTVSSPIDEYDCPIGLWFGYGFDAKLGDHLRLKLYPSAGPLELGPVWLHIIGLESQHHIVKQITGGTTFVWIGEGYAPLVYETTLD